MVRYFISAKHCSQFEGFRLQHVQMVYRTSGFKTKLNVSNTKLSRVNRNTFDVSISYVLDSRFPVTNNFSSTCGQRSWTLPLTLQVVLIVTIFEICIQCNLEFRLCHFLQVRHHAVTSTMTPQSSHHGNHKPVCSTPTGGGPVKLNIINCKTPQPVSHARVSSYSFRYWVSSSPESGFLCCKYLVFTWSDLWFLSRFLLGRFHSFYLVDLVCMKHYSYKTTISMLVGTDCLI